MWKIVHTKYNELLVFDEGAELEIGKLNFGIMSNKTELITPNAKYKINPVGFWGATRELSQAEQRLYKISYTWRGHFEIRSLMDETNDFFVFKSKGLMYNRFSLFDSQKNELVKISTSFQWSALQNDYELHFEEQAQQLAPDNLLILISLYCTYTLGQMMAAG